MQLVAVAVGAQQPGDVPLCLGYGMAGLIDLCAAEEPGLLGDLVGQGNGVGLDTAAEYLGVRVPGLGVHGGGRRAKQRGVELGAGGAERAQRSATMLERMPPRPGGGAGPDTGLAPELPHVGGFRGQNR